MNNKYLRSLLLIVGAAVVVIFLVSRVLTVGTEVKRLDYGDFYNKLEAGQVTELHAIDKQATGKLADGTQYSVSLPAADTAFATEATKKVKTGKVSFDSASNTSFVQTIFGFLPFVLIVALVFLIFRQAQSGGNQALSFGRSRAKMLSENRPKVTFADVAGVDEAKEELGEIVDFLKFPKKYQALGARIPKGVLLLGPPGSGKTLLARAIAGEAGVPFFSISGSDFVEMFVGVGASRVRDLFDQAKKSAPCIIFIDEIDAVGRQRGAGLGGGHDEREQTLNQLLVEMDGFDQNTGVILIAATNRPDVLDPALLRPGRFDRQIVVDRSDIKGREKILEVHARNKPLGKEVDLETLAKRTPGFSGADLENLLNEAALLAARKNKSVIEMRDCDDAIDRVMVGPERKSIVMSQKEKEMTAYHESGHAVVGGMLEKADKIHKVTIIPRGMALGITWSLPEDDRHSQTREELIAVITRALGGRLAEEIQYKDVTTGASNDFEQATGIARRMVTQYGMSDLGPMVFGRGSHQVFLGRDFGDERNYSEEVASKIDEQVREIIEGCYEVGRKILTENWDKVERMVASLLEYETVDAEEVRAIIEGKPYDHTKPSSGTPVVAESEAPARPEEPKREAARGIPPTISPEPA